MRTSADLRAPTVVGALTAGIGAALLSRPGAAASVLGVPDDVQAMRLLGAADLVVAAGLLAGRPRWPWMAVRGALNVPTAVYAVTASARAPRAWPLRAIAAGLLVATVVDLRTAARLRVAKR